MYTHLNDYFFQKLVSGHKISRKKFLGKGNPIFLGKGSKKDMTQYGASQSDSENTGKVQFKGTPKKYEALLRILLS